MSARKQRGVGRFYREAGAVDVAGGVAVTLDGRPVRTPARRPLTVASGALARAIAEEWHAQGETLRPETMPLTRLAATAIDRVADDRARVIDEIAAYVATDLVCYRAATPAELAARQREGWQPLLDWLEARHGVRLAVTEGVIAVEQPDEAHEILREVVAGFDDAGLAALHAIATGCGSLVIALALADGRVAADEAGGLSQIEETYQAEQWGEDTEAAGRRAAVRDQIAAAARFLALCRA